MNDHRWSSRIQGIAVPAICALCAMTGCGPTEGEKFRDLVRQINQLQIDKIQLEERLAKRDADITSLQSQIENLRKQGLAPPAPAFEIDHIEILDITAGADLDGKTGDEAVTVYVRPIDRDGDVIKREGEIMVKLLDHSGSGASRELGVRVDNNRDQLRKLWYGKFWTNHYKVEVPFRNPGDLKPGQEVDVYVSFEDFLTGRKYTARRAVNVNRIIPDAADSGR